MTSVDDVTSGTLSGGTLSGGTMSGGTSTATVSTTEASATLSGGISSTSTTTGSASESSSSGSTTSAESSSTGAPPKVCGDGGFGEAEMYGRMYNDGVPQLCEGISRHIKLIGREGGIITGVPCSTVAKLGCTDCAVGLELKFGIATPEPEGVLDVGDCVYLALKDPLPLEGEQMCRYRQAALWSGAGLPTDLAPLAILGHTTLSIPDTVTAITGLDLQVSTLAVEGECGCVDAEDCCPDKTADYGLKFLAGDELVLSNGAVAAFMYAGDSYTAYNGGAYENGMCEESQRFDWWLLRD